MVSFLCARFPKSNPIGSFKRLCKVANNHNVKQVACMKSLEHKEPDPNKPPPFPYWLKSYKWYHQFTDPMLFRFDENTRIVVVDGPPAVGKSKLCKQIAERFGLLYMPAPTHDDLYINEAGYDLRELNPKLDEDDRFVDLNTFLKNPTTVIGSRLQETYFMMRWDQYMNALLHLLSTGDGVVLDRSMLSDIAFLHAMSESGYVSKPAKDHYLLMRDSAIKFYPRPHLVIYLDVPVNQVQEKIKRRGRSEELNSKVLSTKFLTDLEHGYREFYLKYLDRYSHVLIYDWTTEGNLEAIVEQIEALDFEDYSTDRFADWKFKTPDSVAELRMAVGEGRSVEAFSMVNYAWQSPAPELYGTLSQKSHDVLTDPANAKYTRVTLSEFEDTSKSLFKTVTHRLSNIRRTTRDFDYRPDYMPKTKHIDENFRLTWL